MALLFYLVTAGALISASLRTLVGDDAITSQSLGRLIIAGVVLGLISGVVVGYYFFKSRLAAFICSGVGIGVGAIAGGLAAVDGNRFGELSLIGFGGSWLLILVMLLSARFRKDSDEREVAAQ